MPTPTIAFSLISCADIKAAALSSASISRSKLRNRIVFMKTSKGNFAKLYVQSGDDQHISDLVVYNAAGCIIKTATNLVIHSSFSCDVDTATETNANADLWWHGISAGNHEMAAKNGATFFTFSDYDDISFNEIKNAPYKTQRISREWLNRQIIYCQTSQGRFAKLSLEWGATELIVRRMTVFNSNGTSTNPT
jgi:hypothetical protein